MKWIAMVLVGLMVMPAGLLAQDGPVDEAEAEGYDTGTRVIVGPTPPAPTVANLNTMMVSNGALTRPMTETEMRAISEWAARKTGTTWDRHGTKFKVGGGILAVVGLIFGIDRFMAANDKGWNRGNDWLRDNQYVKDEDDHNEVYVDVHAEEGAEVVIEVVIHSLADGDWLAAASAVAGLKFAF